MSDASDNRFYREPTPDHSAEDAREARLSEGEVERLATGFRTIYGMAYVEAIDWATDLAPVVADLIAAAEQRGAERALNDAAHEIEHSVMPDHPNAGYRDGHAHAAWVVRSLRALGGTAGGREA